MRSLSTGNDTGAVGLGGFAIIQPARRHRTAFPRDFHFWNPLGDGGAGDVVRHRSGSNRRHALCAGWYCRAFCLCALFRLAGGRRRQ